MDENKRNKLTQINYKIKPCCGMCVHSSIPSSGHWGTCNIHQYDHLKHSGGNKSSQRDLSIHAFGYCSDFKHNTSLDYTLHGFSELKSEM